MDMEESESKQPATETSPAVVSAAAEGEMSSSSQATTSASSSSEKADETAEEEKSKAEEEEQRMERAGEAGKEQADLTSRITGLFHAVKSAMWNI